MARVDGAVEDTLADMSPDCHVERYCLEERQAKLRSITEVRQPFLRLRIPPLQVYGGGASNSPPVRCPGRSANFIDAEVGESRDAFAYLEEDEDEEEADDHDGEETDDGDEEQDGDDGAEMTKDEIRRRLFFN